MEIYKAIKYIRLSYTEDKTVESDSVGNQRRMIDDFIAKHPEIEAVAEKIDDGYSGVLFDRPAFTDMIEMVKQHFKKIIILLNSGNAFQFFRAETGYSTGNGAGYGEQ